MNPDPKTPIALNLTLEEVNLILVHLNKGVFQEVNAVINGIIGQAQSQLAAPTPDQPAPVKIEG